MKRLYLLRHGKSSWADPGLDDRDRPLKKRGRRQAPEMGERLKRGGIVPDLIITSPAKRARQTAELVARALGYSQRSIVEREAVYSGGVEGLMHLVRKTAVEVDLLVLVGHNPALEELATKLLATPLDHLPTCGAVGIRLAVDRWREVAAGGGTLLFFDTPKRGRG